MHTYQVKAGDTPMGIAKKFTGNALRVNELVVMNRAKKSVIRGGIPTFAHFKEGEKLLIPRTWPSKKLGLGDCTPCAERRKQLGLGASFTPEDGNVLVETTKAEEACQGHFVTAGPGTPSYQGGGVDWPPIMSTEQNKATNAGQDFYVFCGDDKNLYQVGPGGLRVCSNLDPNFDPFKAATVQCPDGSMPDPSTGECVPINPQTPGITPVNLPGTVNPPGTTTTTTPATTEKTTFEKALPYLGIAAVAAGGAGLIYYMSKPKHGAHRSMENPISGLAGAGMAVAGVAGGALGMYFWNRYKTSKLIQAGHRYTIRFSWDKAAGIAGGNGQIPASQYGALDAGSLANVQKYLDDVAPGAIHLVSVTVVNGTTVDVVLDVIKTDGVGFLASSTGFTINASGNTVAVTDNGASPTTTTTTGASGPPGLGAPDYYDPEACLFCAWMMGGPMPQNYIPYGQ